MQLTLAARKAFAIAMTSAFMSAWGGSIVPFAWTSAVERKPIRQGLVVNGQAAILKWSRKLSVFHKFLVLRNCRAVIGVQLSERLEKLVSSFSLVGEKEELGSVAFVRVKVR